MELSLEQIAQAVGGVVAAGDKDKKFSGAAPFESASNDEISFAADSRFIKKLDETRAGALIIQTSLEVSFPCIIKVDNPQAAFARVLALFYPQKRPFEGISEKAHIGEDFSCGENPGFGPFVFIGNNVKAGKRVCIHPNCVIEDNVVIGDDVILYPNVTLIEGCIIGNRVIIQGGSVIGSDGFGFAPDKEEYVKIPHTGIVEIEDDVEIGANNTIDRATFGKTLIKKGVKTDNLVHVAHNVTVGENSVLVAQVGIAGSVTIGKHAILAGQAGITGHIEIGDNVTVGPQAGVSKSITANQVVSGSPDMPHRLWLRVQRILPRLPELKKKLAALEKRLDRMEEK
ncbi:UDP-3-O-(3-hydroxymyristoyl)glucosamine N-acyltransferase [Desulfobacterales bacterium HSG16]|nr:UDP-3-O-(3-hydroxymyristoyl)glucosamine N-acyltransferase [Desulfobacterales bacterium HSG16]